MITLTHFKPYEAMTISSLSARMRDVLSAKSIVWSTLSRHLLSRDFYFSIRLVVFQCHTDNIKMSLTVLAWNDLQCTNEPAHDEMDLIVSVCDSSTALAQSSILTIDMFIFYLFCSFFAGSFLEVCSNIYMLTTNALARLRLSEGPPELLLIAYVISTLFARAGSNRHCLSVFF